MEIAPCVKQYRYKTFTPIFDAIKLITMNKVFIAILFIASFFTSCHFTDNERIKGNGVMKTENRTAGSFTGIDVSGNADVYIKQDAVVSARIEAEENILPYILTDNRNGILRIYQKEGTNLKLTSSIKIFVSGPSLSSFKASGACIFFSENRITSTTAVKIDLSGACKARLELKAPEIKADLSGAGTITLRGETKELKLDGAGSSAINCFEMLAENTTVDISGAGDAEVFASVKLDVQASGSSTVKYKGSAAISQQVSGASTIKKAE
jgi:phage gp45-like